MIDTNLYTSGEVQAHVLKMLITVNIFSVQMSVHTHL